MSSQYGELRPASGCDRSGSLGYPCKFQLVSRLGSITARHGSSGRQPNFAALNRGRDLYSAGRPSRWALAHISSSHSFCPKRSGGSRPRAESASPALTIRKTAFKTQTGTSVREEQGCIHIIQFSDKCSSLSQQYSLKPAAECRINVIHTLTPVSSAWLEKFSTWRYFPWMKRADLSQMHTR